MRNYKQSGNTAENKSDPITVTSKPAAAKSGFRPNCDIHGIRAIYAQLEKDFRQMVERKIRHLDSVEAQLGEQQTFDLPTDQKGGEAGRLHRQADALRHEIDTSIAFMDYLSDLTDFSLESWAALSDGWAAHCQKLEQEIGRLREAHRQSVDNELTYVTMWSNSLRLQNRKP